MEEMQPPQSRGNCALLLVQFRCWEHNWHYSLSQVMAQAHHCSGFTSPWFPWGFPSLCPHQVRDVIFHLKAWEWVTCPSTAMVAKLSLIWGKHKILSSDFKIQSFTVLPTKNEQISRFSGLVQGTPLIRQPSEHKLSKNTVIQDHTSTAHILCKFLI